MMTCSMRCSRLRSCQQGRRGGHCYYEQGSPLLSHASSRCPVGRRPEESHTAEVGSPEESRPPDTWTESGQTPILREVSSSSPSEGPSTSDGQTRAAIRTATAFDPRDC